MRTLLSFGLVLALSALGVAQPPACAGYTLVYGWDETIDATPLGGGTGPEDIAYNPMSNHIFVAHDFPNSTPDILLEYDLEGNLIQGNVFLPGAGGLCAIPGSLNLLTTNGNTIIEVDPTGTPVPGGINVTMSVPYGIQDLDFDSSGTLWVHHGNTGDFSTVDTTTGATTSQFVLMHLNPSSSVMEPLGSQCMTFNAAGNILVAAAFFQNAGLQNGTITEVTPTGTVVCQGASAANPRLQVNTDPCVASPPSFTIVNGMTWIGPMNELAISNFFLVQNRNVARFAPANTAYAGDIGTASTLFAGGDFTQTAQGDPVIGSPNFGVTVTNAIVGDTVVWGLSVVRDCNNLVLGNGTLYVDIFHPATAFFFFPVNTSPMVFPLPLVGVPPAAAGLEFYSQFAGTDLTDPTLPLILTNCLRAHFDLL